MRKLEGIIIGVRKARSADKKDAIYFTFEDSKINGVGCGMTYVLGGFEKYALGEAITIIESNFRYLILE